MFAVHEQMWKKCSVFFVDRDEFIPIQLVYANANQMNSFLNK